jgi:2'-hydroxyisoflavone reductase
MAITRRDVLRGSAAAAALAACSSGTKQTDPKRETPVAPPKKKILILGGTGFLGPKTIAAAQARGHTITIFNRGKREKIQPLEFDVEHLYGNRDPDKPADDEAGPDGKLLRPDSTPRGLEQLAGRKWDVVIDNSGYFPRMVKASAELLAPNASQYIFISSISVYDENPAAGGDENTRLATLKDPTVETMGDEFENYGGLKALCERAAADAFGDRATIVRPGYIVGPGDPTDRFTYWPVRVGRGGEMLAPGSPDDPLQWIDVRDLAEWLVTLAENGTGGSFNAIGPASSARWGEVLQACLDASPSAGTKLVWVPADWLEKNGAGGEDAFPIWIAPTGKFAGFHKWKNERAKAAGLAFRPMSDTAKALVEWWPGELERRIRVTRELEAKAKAEGKPPKVGGDPTQLRAGPKPEREQELLSKFRAG